MISDTTDPVRRWTRELAHLRMQAIKLRRRSSVSPECEVMDAALAACDGLLRDLAAAQLDRQQLRARIRTEASVWKRLFDTMPSAFLLTDCSGVILDANPGASALLNVSGRHIKGRQLLVYTDNRNEFRELLQRLIVADGPVETSLKLRPRERRPIDVEVIVTPASPNHSAAWLWCLAAREQHPMAESQDAYPRIGPGNAEKAGRVSASTGNLVAASQHP
jgi:PAS domain S-box-containing protein